MSKDTKLITVKMMKDGVEVEALVPTGQAQYGTMPDGTKAVCYIIDGRLVCFNG